MKIEINESTLDLIKDPTMRSYAEIYTGVNRQFMEHIKQSGVEIDPCDYSVETLSKINVLRKKGASIRNDEKSIYINQISPACVACQTGIGSATFFTSLKCNRECFYCFNPNQENFEYYRDNIINTSAELDAAKKRGQQVKHLALTGGEPLLFKREAIKFFETAKYNFPGVYTRLYTSGDYVDQENFESLRDANLDEIRFSIRMQDLQRGNNLIFDRIKLAKNYIPYVMVEMPILPDTLEIMKDILVRLDNLGLYSINLLELCYPLNNADEFNKRGYFVKNSPFRVLYDYWYAGGLPIARSELVCLDLMEYALDNDLKLGIHYCSLENKQTGQIYQQNISYQSSKIKSFSRRDYFLKSAKVFGDDVVIVKQFFDKKKDYDYEINEDYNFIEFHVSKIRSLKRFDVQVGLCTSVLEDRAGESFLRELKVELTTPDSFQISKDV